MGDARINWETSGNDYLAISTGVGSADSTGYISIMVQGDQTDADRLPSGSVGNPTLRIYSADDTQANDFLDIFHNQTNAVINAGNGDINLTSEVEMTGVSGDGTAQILCVKSDGNVGTCTGAYTNGACGTCG